MQWFVITSMMEKCKKPSLLEALNLNLHLSYSPCFLISHNLSPSLSSVSLSISPHNHRFKFFSLQPPWFFICSLIQFIKRLILNIISQQNHIISNLKPCHCDCFSANVANNLFCVPLNPLVSEMVCIAPVYHHTGSNCSLLLALKSQWFPPGPSGTDAEWQCKLKQECPTSHNSMTVKWNTISRKQSDSQITSLGGTLFADQQNCLCSVPYVIVSLSLCLSNTLCAVMSGRVAMLCWFIAWLLKGNLDGMCLLFSHHLEGNTCDAQGQPTAPSGPGSIWYT